MPVLAFFGHFSFAWIPLILMYQGCHELQHATFFQKQDTASNNVLGAVCSSLFFHNFEFVRRSHGQHHKIGRMDLPNAMVDHPQGFMPSVFYYLNLVGFNYFMYMLAAPIWILNKRIAEVAFGVNGANRGLVLMGIALTLVWIVFLYSTNTLSSILLSYFIFSLYWGMIQNSAHYGLEFGRGDDYLYTAKTYRVPAVLHFLSFGTPFSHFEHHVLPGVPGVLLNEKVHISGAIDKSGIEPYSNYSAKDYFKDLIVRQWATPYPKTNTKWKN
ncbi:fatty acid desaturase [Sulfitobacter sp. MF3-043]